MRARRRRTVRLLHGDLGEVRDLLTRADALPADDKFAQLTRATWTQGLLIDMPAGVQLEHLVVRWVLGEGDRAPRSARRRPARRGAHASVVEELVPSERTTGDGPQSFFAGTAEVVLGPKATLRVSSLQELPSNLVAFQHRTASIGEGAELRWALAQLGSRLVRSQVDNRLVGDRSSVEQVEIVFGGADQIRPDLVHDPHRPRHDRQPALQGRAARPVAKLHERPTTIDRSAIGTDSYLASSG